MYSVNLQQSINFMYVEDKTVKRHIGTPQSRESIQYFIDGPYGNSAKYCMDGPCENQLSFFY